MPPPQHARVSKNIGYTANERGELSQNIHNQGKNEHHCNQLHVPPSPGGSASSDQERAVTG